MNPAEQKPTCAVCNTIRYFLMAATPILILVYLKPELDLPEIPLQVVVGNAIWVLLIPVSYTHLTLPTNREV